MLFALKSFGQYFRTYPLRGVLTILTIAIGTAALIITFSLSFDVNGALEKSLSENGRRIVISNATLSEDGSVSPQMPPMFSGDVPATLAREYESLSDVTAVSPVSATRVSADGQTFQIRSAISTNPEYADLMDLELLTGTYFTQEDVDSRSQVVVLSESTARIIFGSPENAMGQDVISAVPVVTFEEGGRPRFSRSQQPYEVIGVFADVTELEREAFGVGDLIIPFGLDVPAGLDLGFRPDTVIMARVTGATLEKAASRIAGIVELEYGEDAVSTVWEGSPGGPAPLIEESRRSVSSFALTINVLGIVVLVASSIGIFSIMLVEVLNRMREIGLRRALGATRAGIRRFFMAQAIYFSLAGSAVGTALGFLFYRVIGATLGPFFESSGLSASDLDLVAPGVIPIGLAVGIAVLIGAVFGFFPAVSASRTPIVECIKEDAA